MIGADSSCCLIVTLSRHWSCILRSCLFPEGMAKLCRPRPFWTKLPTNVKVNSIFLNNLFKDWVVFYYYICIFFWMSFSVILLLWRSMPFVKNAHFPFFPTKCREMWLKTFVECYIQQTHGIFSCTSRCYSIFTISLSVLQAMALWISTVRQQHRKLLQLWNPLGSRLRWPR